jgi:catechol O-methyltransferase
MRRVLEVGGRRMPFLRWSFVRMMVGLPRLLKRWQVGDGREQAFCDHILRNAPAGDVNAAIAAADAFCYEVSFMINVGDEKGAILDGVIEATSPRQLLELGTYCGYSGLRMARAMGPDARLVSLEFNPDNARIARRVWEHAGIGDRATVVVGTLGDGGATADRLEADHGFEPGSVDLVFLDHDKNAYLPDIELIVDRGWLHAGSVAVADNVKFPGAPKYRAYMEAHEGSGWRTTEHETHAEYQTLIKDLVLESERLAA